MTRPSDQGLVLAARQTLALLGKQANGLRAEIAALQRDLAQAKEDFDDTRAAQLLQANEQLILSALRARELAETAMADLGALARTSQFDELTETPNRALMLDRIETAIAGARRHGSRAAVLFLDLDGFKQVNDTHGHAAGDRVLRQAAQRLSASVRETDTVSRFGGDEFLVLLAEVAGRAEVALVATKMLAALARADGDDVAASALSASIGIALHPEDGADAATLIERADEAMYQAKRRGGRRFEFHSDLPASPLATTGTPAGAAARVPLAQQLATLRDVNEQLMISGVAADALAHGAEEAHARQIKFLAMVAHELRNPLMPLRTVAELLAHGKTDATLLGRLQAIIRRQVGHMARLVDDLLDGARAGTGKFRLERSRVDMEAIIRHAVENCRPAMDERRQHFAATLPAGLFPVDGDPMRLTQVMVNLLDNASKYTPAGGAITLLATETPQALTIRVSDTGIGITAAALPRIFDLFVQETHARAHHGHGLGVGLAVVRELTEAHGGRIVANSAGKNCGSEFVVTLPRMADEAAA
jgi:diguanylate cyclase (GGDEF)-like protein